jgi:excisionase family DNA binding protein
MPKAPPQLPIKPLVVSITRAMELTGLGRNKIYKSLGTGELQSSKHGRRRLINFSSLERMVGVADQS